MTGFWDIVNDVIREADIILEVLDARFPEETRNREIEDKVKAAGKILIYVVNKCDLVEKKLLEQKKKELKPSVFVSSKKRYGMTILLHMLKRYAEKEKIIVGVLGYPNTGKSSVINALKGRKSAKVSSESGFTKAKQLIKVANNIYLLDTPGVYPYMEKDSLKHALIAAVDYSKVKDPEDTALKLIEAAKEKFERHYNLKAKTAEELLEKIALKFKHIRKGGIADTERAARAILKDWQKGRISN